MGVDMFEATVTAPSPERSPSLQGRRFRGQLGIGTMKAIKQATDPATRRAVTAALSADARRLMELRYSAVGWYSLEGVPELFGAFAAATGQEPEEFALYVGKFIVRERPGPVGRGILRRFGSPARIASYMDMMFGLLYDSGNVAGSYDAAAGTLRIRVSRWDGHHPLTCTTVTGSVEGIAAQFHHPTLVGAERTCCLSDGSAFCEHVYSFV